MNIAIVSGSPKKQNSSSEMLAQQLFLHDKVKPEIFHCKDRNPEKSYARLCTYDTLLLTFPLYFDALPSHFLQFLLAWEDYMQSHPVQLNIYVIVNCGFFEGCQNQLAVKIMENWCHRTKVTFLGGIGIGAGPMLNGMQSLAWHHGPKKPIYRALCELKQAMTQGLPFPTCYVQPHFPRRLYMLMAHHSWNQQLAQNGYDAQTVYPRHGKKHKH